MARAISNKNVLQARFNVAEFDGAFKASFGKPELRGTWLIYGGSGCGKTTFVSHTLWPCGIQQSGARLVAVAAKGLGARQHGRGRHTHYPAG